MNCPTDLRLKIPEHVAERLAKLAAVGPWRTASAAARQALWEGLAVLEASVAGTAPHAAPPTGSEGDQP